MSLGEAYDKILRKQIRLGCGVGSMNDKNDVPDWAGEEPRLYTYYAHYSDGDSEEDNRVIRDMLLGDLEMALTPSPDDVSAMQYQLMQIFHALNEESFFTSPIQSLYFIQDCENGRYHLSCYGDIDEGAFAQVLTTENLETGEGKRLANEYKIAIETEAHVNFRGSIDNERYDEYELEYHYDMLDLSKRRMLYDFRDALDKVLQKGVFTRLDKFKFPVLIYVETHEEQGDDYPEAYAFIVAKITQRGEASTTRHEGTFKTYEVAS